MDDTTLALLAVIGSPIAAVLTVFIKSWWDGRTAKVTAQPAVTNAETTQFSAHVEGFKAQFARQDKELERMDKELKEERKYRRQLEWKVDLGDKVNDILLDHLEMVERLVPHPPGPPARPDVARLKREHYENMPVELH